MKILISTIAAGVVLSSLAGTPARGEPPATVTIFSPSDDSIRQAAGAAEEEGRFDQMRKLLEQADRQFARAQQDHRLLAQNSSSRAAGAEDAYAADVFEQASRVFDSSMGTYNRRVSGSPAKALVIRSTDGDAATQANLEEDLAVMSHILDKALAESVGGDNRGRTAMGINVVFAPGANPLRSLYLDGYGALFLLRVNFPLLEAPKTSEAPKEKPATDSSWEAARREVYGQPPDGKAPPAGEEFDAEKVNKLKDTLINALKDASNIRGLKSDDTITLCVTGGGNAGSGRGRKVNTVRIVPNNATVTAPGTITADNRTGQFLYTTQGDSGGPTRGTILTIRVKKSDVDAFARGKLTLDEFRKKAGLATYRASIDGGGGPGNGGFGSSGFGGFGAGGSGGGGQVPVENR